MPIFNKDSSLDELNAQLESANADLATAQDTIKSLKAENKQLKTVASLSAKAEKLGFEGSVNDLLEQANGDYTTALEAMIEQKDTKAKAPKNDFLQANNESVGDGSDDEDTPSTGAEAITFLMNTQSLSRREATAQARESYPTLFGKVTN